MFSRKCITTINVILAQDRDYAHALKPGRVQAA
ncbi:hypothetical protein L585_14180 [Pantoea ananatis BRT175]|nr:hypothetical protein L585_14180 [Pantoea ananatis BRT175]PKC46697.1 hypothetical protein V461_03240 [Pantoea ananatis BRT98]